MKKNIVLAAAAFLTDVLMMLAVYRSATLLSFINMSFYLGGISFLFALLGSIVKTGFFDTMFMSFRKLFESQKPVGEKERISRLSDIITVNLGPAYWVSFILLGMMLISLALYYL